MTNVHFMYQVDIGYSPEKGYAAVVKDVRERRSKGIKGNSIRQLLRRIAEAVAEDEQKKRRFPLEQDSAPVIITPDRYYG